jgi:inorganic pyrophosphatase/exopolyphosphatase
MYSTIYLVGYVKSDTDSISSAIGYAWFLKERDQLYNKPVRACVLNPQTSWLLKYFGKDHPVLLTDLSPCFESVSRMIEATIPEEHLQLPGILPAKKVPGIPMG